MYVAIILTWYKIRHKVGCEHNLSIIRRSIKSKHNIMHNWLEPN